MIIKIILMRTIFILFSFFCFFTGFTQEIITVSENGPYYTLEEAYNLILANSNEEKEITKSYIIQISGNSINMSNNPNLESIIWEVSGTNDLYIKIKSDDFTTINKPKAHQPAILLKNVKNIHIKGLTFSNAKFGLRFVNADSCSVNYCKFFVNEIGCTNFEDCPGGGGGAIELSGEVLDKNGVSFKLDETNRSRIDTITTSDDNVIKNNYITLSDNMRQYIGKPESSLWHGIYLSRSRGNIVKYNTIDDTFGDGIHFWHEDVQNNLVTNNFVYNSIDSKDILGVRHNILVGKDFKTFPVAQFPNDKIYPVKNDSIINNYINTDRQKEIGQIVRNTRAYRYFSKDNIFDENIWGLNNLVINKNLIADNVTKDNVEFFYESDNIKAIDPLYYEENLDIIETLSGDFDGDGSKNEIAAFVKTGSNSSKIILWKRDKIQGKYFLKFLGAWWESNNFDATQMKDRLVAGDFTGDGRDDIAGFRDMGNNSSRIEVFMSSSEGKFKPDGHGKKWWEANNYDANQFTGRLVAGDFTGNGRDDIAGYRDMGNNSSRIEVFMSSSEGKFKPDGHGKKWWEANNYDANQFTGRLVAGDFTNNGRYDIAGFRDMGNNSSRIEVFMSSSEGKFKPDGHGKKWWEANNYDANQFTGRLVAGDFTNDGRCDIAGFRDMGNNSSRIEIFMSSSEGKFKPDGHGKTWWESELGKFDANQISSFLDLNLHTNDEDTIPDLIAFRKLNDTLYDTDDKYRTIGWFNTNPKFKQTNELGIPWLISVNASGEIAAKNNSISETKSENKLLNEKSTKFSAYPNPFDEEITIQFQNDTNGIVQLNVYSYSGQLIEKILNNQMESGIQTIKLNMEKFPEGIYFLELNNTGKKEYQKIILMNK